MATTHLSDFFRRLTDGMAAEILEDHSDRKLVERMLAGRDEAAFQAIVHRHGPMVYRVCWRVSLHSQDSEDAFQATFLVLAQRLRRVRKHASLASWLHGVARRVALKAKVQSAGRRRHEHEAALPEAGPADDVTWRELRSALDAELGALPEKWRLPLILCYLEGRTQDEAAGELAWSKSTLRRRLEEARVALGRRLNGRGIVCPAALSAVLLSDCLASATPELVASTVEAAASVAVGKTVAAAASVEVAALTQGVLNAMWITKLNTVTAVLLILGMVAFGGGLSMREMGAAGQHVKAGQNDVQPSNPRSDPTKKERDESKKAASKKAKFESDMKKLQGTWTTVTATKDGTERKEEKGVELEFKGEEVIIREPARKETFVMSISPSAYPGGDLAFYDSRPPVSSTEGRSRGTDTALGFTYGIFKIEGDTLTLCIQSAYSIPTDFSDKNQMLWVLKRKPEPK
jgi:RNA polymerase sigma factor (sigma-70 family)